MRAPQVEIVRVYDHLVPAKNEYRVLIDRLWPRGIRKEALSFDRWAKDIAPTPELRKFYSHELERFELFKDRYLSELSSLPAKAEVELLIDKARKERLILLTASKDIPHSSAWVLHQALVDQLHK